MDHPWSEKVRLSGSHLQKCGYLTTVLNYCFEVHFSLTQNCKTAKIGPLLWICLRFLVYISNIVPWWFFDVVFKSHKASFWQKHENHRRKDRLEKCSSNIDRLIGNSLKHIVCLFPLLAQHPDVCEEDMRKLLSALFTCWVLLKHPSTFFMRCVFFFFCFFYLLSVPAHSVWWGY